MIKEAQRKGDGNGIWQGERKKEGRKKGGEKKERGRREGKEGDQLIFITAVNIIKALGIKLNKKCFETFMNKITNYH